MNDLVLFYKIGYDLVTTNLPSKFEFVKGGIVRYTREISVIIDEKNKTQIKFTMKTISEITSFFFRSMLVWNKIPYDTPQTPSITSFRTRLVKHLWDAQND